MAREGVEDGDGAGGAGLGKVTGAFEGGGDGGDAVKRALFLPEIVADGEVGVFAELLNLAADLAGESIG